MSRLPFVLLLVSLSVPAIGAQVPAGGQTPAVPAQGRGGRGGQMQGVPGLRGAGPAAAALANKSNVRVELAIAETAGGATTNKTVLLITSNGRRGSVRSDMSSPSEGSNIELNVDALPSVLSDEQIFLELTFLYTPQRSTDAAAGGARSTGLTEQLSVFLTDGKPLLVSQSADPRGDRKVTVQVTATVMK
jgi:hypothetical protein